MGTASGINRHLIKPRKDRRPGQKPIKKGDLLSPRTIWGGEGSGEARKPDVRSLPVTKLGDSFELGPNRNHRYQLRGGIRELVKRPITKRGRLTEFACRAENN